MSLLINDEIIWISIPRCASNSIERSLYSSKLKIDHSDQNYWNLKPGDAGFEHKHFNLCDLRSLWPNKKTLRIKRDWFDRWNSSLEHLWYTMKKYEHVPKIEYSQIDNEFIYRTFNREFGNVLYGEGGKYNMFKYLIHNFTPTEKFKADIKTGVLLSQNYWLSGEKKCDYEFDINNLHGFKNFIWERYGEKLEIPHSNKSRKLKNKIIPDEKLKKHVWEVFERPFQSGLTTI